MMQRSALKRSFLAAGSWQLAALALVACTRAPAPPAPAGPPTILGEEVEAVAPAPLPAQGPTLPAPPPIAREFRGVWVATIGNMDWPSRRGLSTERQQAELRAILDRSKALGLNAVLFQVRPAGDALYASPLEPWSEYLTGEMGRAPSPYYDPLSFAIEEAHRRGLELHAWFNPFRARHPSARSAPSATHITRARPGLVRRYGTHLWMDPSEPEVQEQTLQVVLDVVRRYDVDGVHIDDYFYPYREYHPGGALIQFPDGENYERYRAAGGHLGRSDWRRGNVDRFVERMYTAVKREKPRVKVGISPFGIWRPGHPAPIRGLDAYEEIFADARKWLNQGWLDYFSPQLYWQISAPQQSFPVLLDWWVRENRHDRHIWPGHFTSRVGTGSRNWRAGEVVAQIEEVRRQPGSTGSVHFNMTTLMRSPDGVSQRLAEAYDRPALVPPSPWLHAAAPAPPRIHLAGCPAGATRLLVAPEGAEEVFLWTVRARSAGAWSAMVLPGREREITLAGDPDRVAVTAVGRTGNESPIAELGAGCAAERAGGE